MNARKLIILSALCIYMCVAEELKDFEFFSPDDDGEIMVAQESRLYHTFVKPPVTIVKPNGVTNSHRPQFNVDSIEDLRENRADQDIESTSRSSYDLFAPSYKSKTKENLIRGAVLRALERKDHVGKFAEILPIIRSMSGHQRQALASLVASQVVTPPGRSPLNLVQVRSMFGNTNTTSDLMLPILLDMANLFRKATKHNKVTREVKMPQDAQITRRSDSHIDDEPFETYNATTEKPTQSKTQKNRRVRPQKSTNTTQKDTEHKTEHSTISNTVEHKDGKDKSTTKKLPTTAATANKILSNKNATAKSNDTALDLTADSSNQTLSKDLPVAEKWRSANRYSDRKGSIIRRGNYSTKPSQVLRRTTDPSVNTIRKRPAPGIRKLPAVSEGNCELFTNSLCLHSEDYPTDAIIQSIRRNKAAAGALLADFKDPGEGAVDGVTALQEAKYTADHYLISNRRGDTANRDFAGAGEAGFMCPSIVKYARPQRARATSGQWKYIVNTGEHTQTLRLEKCLKPKESCTYLTDNFKSKCVQVYNYHRLLTWDQQNGLHMDIFKVPTCCSCHIEGYSVNFPPVGNRIHDSAEPFAGEDLSADHGNQAFENVQSSIQRPSITKNPPPFLMKPLDSYSPINDNHNLIGSSFSNSKLADIEQLDGVMPTGPVDSYGSYFPDSFNQASSIRNVKRPFMSLSRNPITSMHHDTVTLPSYLEPPTPAGPSSYSFVKESPSKYKITSSSQFKRGAPRPNRRPIRKKTSGAPDDLMPAGSSIVDSFTNKKIESLEDFNDDLEEPDFLQGRVTIAPKLQSQTSTPAPSSTMSISSTTNKPEREHKDTITTQKEATGSTKKVNYNYHPIIDFFEEGKGEAANTSIDREDSVPSFETMNSEWTPINHPVSRSPQNNLNRKKHK